MSTDHDFCVRVRHASPSSFPAHSSELAHSSALLNADYTVSRSHAMAGSIKTNAPRSFVHDIVREWIKEHPVAMKNVKEGSPAKVLLAKEQRCVFFAR